MNISIGGERFELSQQTGDTWWLRAADGRVLALPDEDVKALLGIIQDSSECGANFAAIREAVQAQYDMDHLAVLLDSMTLQNAGAALSGEYVAPLQLLDLAVLVQAVVFNDVVLGQPLEWFDGLAGAPPVFVSLSLSNHDLHPLWMDESSRRRGIEPGLAEDWGAIPLG